MAALMTGLCLALVLAFVRGPAVHAFDSRILNIRNSAVLGGRQSFDSEPTHTEVNPGEVGVLTCTVFDKDRDSLCRWQKDGISIRVPQVGKYEWQSSPDGGDCSLRITDADINFDDGTYWFFVSLGFGIGLRGV